MLFFCSFYLYQCQFNSNIGFSACFLGKLHQTRTHVYASTSKDFCIHLFYFVSYRFSPCIPFLVIMFGLSSIVLSSNELGKLSTERSRYTNDYYVWDGKVNGLTLKWEREKKREKQRNKIQNLVLSLFQLNQATVRHSTHYIWFYGLRIGGRWQLWFELIFSFGFHQIFYGQRSSKSFHCCVLWALGLPGLIDIFI